MSGCIFLYFPPLLPHASNCVFMNPKGPLSGKPGSLTFDLLYQKLFCVRARWYSVGLNFGLLPSTLDALEQKHRGDPERCIAAVCEKWIDTKPEATWDDVLEMLESPSLDEKRLAKQIRQQLANVTS